MFRPLSRICRSRPSGRGCCPSWPRDYAEEVFAGDIEHDPTIHFLPKPFSLKGLAGKVKEVMES